MTALTLEQFAFAAGDRVQTIHGRQYGSIVRRIGGGSAYIVRFDDGNERLQGCLTLRMAMPPVHLPANVERMLPRQFSLRPEPPRAA